MESAIPTAVVAVTQFFVVEELGIGILGRVISGTLKPGMAARVPGHEMTVQRIEVGNLVIERAHADDFVSVVLSHATPAIAEQLIGTELVFTDDPYALEPDAD